MTTSHDIVWHWLREGWKYRGLGALRGAEKVRYRDRVKYEMDMIESKDFVDYFLIVSDLVRYAKDSGFVVGPARGSAAASLVCWLLRITEVNPLLYPNLVFERFIDVSRSDLPDIDLDFESECRYDLYQYWVRKYGAECVANIGTFTYYRAKNSLDDVARVHRIPAWDVSTVKDRILVRSSGDLRASDTIEDTKDMFPDVREVFERHPELEQSQELEGNVKGQSVHAAGLVVSSGPLRRVAPVYGRKVAGEMREVLVFDKYDAERQGMLKVDVLGLSTMSMISECLRWLNMPLQAFYDMPLDDPDVIDGFRRNDVVGVFQFDGLTQRNVNGQIAPDSFDELCDVNALARPGPLHNGAVEAYTNVKRGLTTSQAIHPMYDAITRTTHGLPVYQEQILRVVTEIGQFDWTSASYIRKIMSRKLGDQEFNRQWDKFWQGARANGLEEEPARAMWTKCITAGSYAFNAAHCVSYAMIGYWCMWLKVYHPEEFYAASLKHTATAVDKKKGINKPVEMIRDAHKHDVEVLPPDLRASSSSWGPTAAGVRMGFTQIPGIGDKVAESIVQWRDEQPGLSAGDWSQLQAIKGIGAATVEKIESWCGTPDPFRATKMHRDLEAVRAALRDDPDFGHLPIPTHTADEIPNARTKVANVVWLGVLHQRNLRDYFEYYASKHGEQLDPAKVRRPDLAESVRMHGRDEHDITAIVVDRFRYPKMKKMIWDIELSNDVVLVRGEKPGYTTNKEINAHEIWVFTPDD